MAITGGNFDSADRGSYFVAGSPRLPCGEGSRHHRIPFAFGYRLHYKTPPPLSLVDVWLWRCGVLRSYSLGAPCWGGLL
jgi:hypothetical protein